MTVFLYARVSSIDQNLAMQHGALTKKYPEGVYRAEKQSGTSLDGRDVLKLLLDMIGEGDKLVVWKLDRLARNLRDLLSLVDLISSKGAALEIIDQNIDTSSASDRAFLQMLGVFAEFETNLRKERQWAGIQKAKEEGRHLGRKNILTEDKLLEIQAKRKDGATPTALAKEYGVSRGTIYNICRES